MPKVNYTPNAQQNVLSIPAKMLYDQNLKNIQHPINNNYILNNQNIYNMNVLNKQKLQHNQNINIINSKPNMMNLQNVSNLPDTKKNLKSSPGLQPNNPHNIDVRSSNFGSFRFSDKATNGNVIKKINVISNPGSDISGKSKDCQDTFFALKNINNIKEFNVFAVLDGHGQYGKEASNEVKKYITSKIEENKDLKSLKGYTEIINFLRANSYSFITSLFESAEKHLKKCDFDCNFSGTTCVAVFQIGSYLICANCGDSRAVLVRLYGNNIVKLDEKSLIETLSTDHKPDNEKEKARIIASGGEIHQHDGIGPMRVFAKGQMYPGIAMTRSIGDLFATRLGVIPIPEFKEIKLDENMKMLIICCDGIWDHVEYKTIIDLGNKYYYKNDPKRLCAELINNAIKLWHNKGKYVDDITVVTVFFN